jgi:protein O-GlcNAcase/histone acetyltransferase
LPADEKAVYEVCRKTCDDGADGTEIFPFHTDLVGDKMVGAFLTNSPDYCFVVEDQDGVCGYVLSALDCKVHNQKQSMAWIPAMQEKYPKPEKTNDLSPAEEMIMGFHTHKPYTSASLVGMYPSVVRIDMLPERCNEGIIRHCLASAIAALKTNGSHGIYAEVHVGDRNTVERYAAVQMKEVQVADIPEDLVIVARPI